MASSSRERGLPLFRPGCAAGAACAPEVEPVDPGADWASRGGGRGVGPGVHPGGCAGVLEAWFCRWKAEVVHRHYKQNTGAG